MNTHTSFRLVALLALISNFGVLATSARGADFFVCDCATGADPACQPGDDAAAGSEAAPWQSYQRARSQFASLVAGDSIRFCRGGQWAVTGSSRWVNPNCSAANPCVVGAYDASWAQPGAGRPVLERLDGDNGFGLDDGGNADHEEGYRFEGLELRGDGVSNGNGFFLFNDIDDVTIVDSVITDFAIGVHVAGSNPCNPNPNCNGSNERVVLMDSVIANNHRHGWLGGSSGSQILFTQFQANGSTAVFDHNIYVSGNTLGMRVIGNSSYQSTLDSLGSCGATSIVVHGTHTDLIIEANHVWEDVGAAGLGCWGIGVDPGHGAAEAFTDVVIRGNVVENVGNVAIGVAACRNCLIENNIVVHAQPFNTIAIAAPSRASGAGDQVQDQVMVRNNSIWIDGVGGSTAIAVTTEGQNHGIVSNAIHLAGTSSGTNCLEATLPPSAYTAIDHNLCFMPNAAGEWADGVGSLAAWQAATGFDLASATTDPGFRNPALGDLRPFGMAAPMVDVGHPTLSAPAAIDGLPRDAAPDRGAWEWRTEIFSDGFESGDTTQWSG